MATPSYSCTIHDLPSEVLENCLSFLGSGHFIFIAAVSSIFHTAYSNVSKDDGKITSEESVTSSIGRARLYVDDYGCDIDQLRVIWRSAAAHGRVNIMQWAFELGYSRIWMIRGLWKVIGFDEFGYNNSYYGAEVSFYAARHGQINALKWLRKNGCPWDKRSCADAARSGHLTILQWLRENGCPWDVETCAAAARDGHLTVLQWLRENGCPWNEETCAAAARGGHLTVLQWLRENGCPWNEWTCALAAGGGHLTVLQWLRENGCP